MAIVLDELQQGACIEALQAEPDVLISAATVAESLIVADRRNVADEMTRLIVGPQFEIVPVTPASSRQVAAAYERWGKGAHPASLNFGDCFSYEVAKEHSCRLLFVGSAFSRTHLESILCFGARLVESQA